MPDWAIVLIGAFGGGLVGAVLQPVVTYVMGRFRSSDQIRRNRERYLRRMMVARIREGRSAALEALAAIGRASHCPPAPPEESASPTVPPRDTPLWQPERISDPDLQTLARRYNEVTRDLRVRARFGNQQVKETLPELVTQSEALEVEITRRMDELEWPEVDD